MKNILLTNDDGFDSNGLLALRDALKDLARITILAPSENKSACSHSLSIGKVMNIIRVEEDFYKLVNGTSSDCVYLAMGTFFKNNKPDLIISGINKGSNMGEDVTYSGTVGACMEGVFLGVPSIAISQVVKYWAKIDSFDYDLAKKTIRDIVSRYFKQMPSLAKREILNINIPPIGVDECNGYKVTNLAHRLYESKPKACIDPNGKEYFWLGLASLAWKDRGEYSDCKAISDNYVSLSPIKCDLSSYESMGVLKTWL